MPSGNCGSAPFSIRALQISTEPLLAARPKGVKPPRLAFELISSGVWRNTAGSTYGHESSLDRRDDLPECAQNLPALSAAAVPRPHRRTRRNYEEASLAILLSAPLHSPRDPAEFLRLRIAPLPRQSAKLYRRPHP
eukprot:scaffold140_cov565-Prasinococcus_capsulatus_cf.AAC.32